MDVVGDFITIIRNATAANKVTCCAQWSSLRAGIAKILKECGYIKDFSKEETPEGHFILKIFLKYVNGVSAIAEIGRIGTPGRRRYVSKDFVPSILGGMGNCILSTSRGILSGKEAKKMALGGELMCYVL